MKSIYLNAIYTDKGLRWCLKRMDYNNFKVRKTPGLNSLQYCIDDVKISKRKILDLSCTYFLSGVFMIPSSI